MEKEATIEIISELIIKMIKGTIDMDEKVVLDCDTDFTVSIYRLFVVQ